MQQQANQTALTTDDPRPFAVARRAFLLEVVSGPDKGLLKRLERGTYVVGSHAGSDIVLSDRTVSRRHLEIRVCGDHLQVTDAASTNGTWLGDARVNRVFVNHPTRMQLGASTEIALHESPCCEPCPGLARDTVRELLGPATATHRVCTLIDRATRSAAPLLIVDPAQRHVRRLAEAVHRARGARGPFITLDCRGLLGVDPELHASEQLSDAASCELTSALERAAGGTLLLERIESLSRIAQARLLRALERPSSRSAGSADCGSEAVRLIAGAGCSLGPMVECGQFRRDLFLRIAVDEVVLPTPESVDESARIEAQSRQFLAPRMMTMPFTVAKGQLVDSFERRYLVHILARHKGNMSRAARAARLGRSHMHRLLKKHRIELSRLRAS